MGKRAREGAEATEQDKRRVEIWTDGSHIKGTQKMGFGIYIRIEEREGEFSVSASPAVLSRALGVHGTDAVYSNPTLELAAAIVAIRRVSRHVGATDHVLMYADYNGVPNYANGVWDARRANAKTPLFARAARCLRVEVENLRKRTRVDVIWVRGHTGNAGNDRADSLAKAGDDRDTFDDAFGAAQ